MVFVLSPAQGDHALLVVLKAASPAAKEGTGHPGAGRGTSLPRDIYTRDTRHNSQLARISGARALECSQELRKNPTGKPQGQTAIAKTKHKTKTRFIFSPSFSDDFCVASCPLALTKMAVAQMGLARVTPIWVLPWAN